MATIKNISPEVNPMNKNNIPLIKVKIPLSKYNPIPAKAIGRKIKPKFNSISYLPLFLLNLLFFIVLASLYLRKGLLADLLGIVVFLGDLFLAPGLGYLLGIVVFLGDLLGIALVLGERFGGEAVFLFFGLKNVNNCAMNSTPYSGINSAIALPISVINCIIVIIIGSIT